MLALQRAWLWARAAPSERGIPEEEDATVASEEADPQPHPMHERGQAGSRLCDGHRKKPKSRTQEPNGMGDVAREIFKAQPATPAVEEKVREMHKFITLEKELKNVTQDEAHDVLRSWQGLSWRYLSSGTSANKTRFADYRCTVHVGCEAELRLCFEGEKRSRGRAQLWSNTKVHSREFTQVPHPGKGIGGEFVEEITLLHAMYGAKGIHLELRQKYGMRPETLDAAKANRIPTKRSSQMNLRTNADLLALVSANVVESYDEVLARGEDEVLVLKSFCVGVNLTVYDPKTGEDTGKKERAVTMGYVATSRVMLEFFRNYLLKQQADEGAQGRSRVPFVLHADGTYRLSKGVTTAGAVLVDLGTSTIVQTEGRDVSTFVPLLYMFCQVECTECYETIFTTFKNLPKFIFGETSDIFRPDFGTLDNATYIANAYQNVWPADPPASGFADPAV